MRELLLAILLVFTAVDPAESGTGAHGRNATENWEQARSEVKEPNWRDWLIKERERVDFWITNRGDLSSEKAGWAHQFIDARTGAFIPWNPSTDCANFGAPESGRARGCLTILRSYNIQTVLVAARLGRLLEDGRYTEWAASQVDNYRRFPVALPGEGRLFVQLLDEAVLAHTLTEAVRLLKPNVSSSRAEGWCDGLLRPMAGEMLAARQKANNITVWYAAAAVMIGMECKDPALRQSALLEPKLGLADLLGVGLDRDGFWFELSAQYQRFVATALSQLLENASLRGESDPVRFVWPRLRAMLAAPSALALGDGDGPIINDTNKAVSIPDEALLKESARVVPTAPGVRAARASQDWAQLLDPISTDEPALALRNASSSEWIEGARTLMLRQGTWRGLIRGGQMAPFHAHQDTLSIELKHGATWIFRNSVTPGYGSDLQRNFYKLAAAVSTPLVDGNGTSNWFKQLDSQQASPRGVSARQTSFARGIQVERSLTVEDDVLNDTVAFAMAPPREPRVVAQLYHTDCAVGTAGANQMTEDAATTPRYSVSRFFTEWRQLNSAGESWRTQLQCGGRLYALTVRSSRAFTAWRAQSPALAPARQRTTLLFEVVPGADAKLVTSITPMNPAP